MAGIRLEELEKLETCFLPIDRRSPAKTCFFRILGHDGHGKIPALVNRFAQAAQNGGISIRDGISNPTEPEITRFSEAIATPVSTEPAQIARHITIWLGQLRASQRQKVHTALLETLERLRKQGANDHILKNAYIKFMCWLRTPFGRVLTGLEKPQPPKILWEGKLSKYEVLLLHLLHLAGCDVWYVHFTSDEFYRKADPSVTLSILVRGDCFTPVETAPLQAKPSPKMPAPRVKPAQNPVKPVPKNPAPVSKPKGPVPWAGMGQEVSLNIWIDDKPVWEAVLLPRTKRGTQTKLWTLFATCFGVDERGAYRNRLFQLKRTLDTSPKKCLLVTQNIPAPSPVEVAHFQGLDKNASRADLLEAVARRLTPSCGRVPSLLTQWAFMQTMEQHPEADRVRLLNHAIRLACWLWRYAEQLLAGTDTEQPPVLLYYGAIREAEITLLWALAHMGIDILYVCPDQQQQKNFVQHFLPHVWLEVCFPGTLSIEPFPVREEKIRVSTTAYDASQELNHLLYGDTGMFRDRQFTRSQPVTLQTTYDEVGQLWPEEAQYRPSFRAESGVVYVPNLFTKISGVEQGDCTLYWNKIRAMITDDTYLVTSVPFWKPAGPSMSVAQANAFLHNGRLDPRALKTSHFYRYDYLPDDIQDYILEKIQALMDYDLILGGGADLSAVMLAVLMNLDKELLRLIQNFDFTRQIPKFLIVDVTEKLFTREECILLAFLNLVGFDIAVFTPTGYRNLEKYLRPDSFDSLVIGEFVFDCTVPDLSRRNKTGGWLGRILGGW